MSPRTAKLTKGTFISIGLLIPIVTVVWIIATVSRDVEAHQKTLDKHEIIIEQNAQYMKSIDSRLSHIEGALPLIERGGK